MTVLFQVAVDTRPIDELRLRLSPGEVGRIGRAAMLESLAFLRGAVVQLTPVNTGISRASVTTAVRGGLIGDLYGVVGTPLEHMVVLEFGRKPGSRMPPVAAIEMWALRKIGVPGLGFVIARSIARGGTKPVGMFRRAAESGHRTVQRIFIRHFGAL